MNFTFTAQPATFLARPNRFRIEARLQATGDVVAAHCADPGRLRELLIPGVTVYVSRADNPARKTAYDLRFVTHPENGRLVSLDSRVPNALVWEELQADRLAPFAGAQEIAREVTTPLDHDGVRSRFDFRLVDAAGTPCWIEVKSATLVEDGVARFPDAPTVRGRRHVEELTALRHAGDRAAVLFIIQRPDAVRLEPKYDTDPEFAAALATAADAGVELYAYTCDLTPERIALRARVPVTPGDFPEDL